MKLEHFRYVSEISQAGSINKAAARLMITQPHLSAYIRDLEREIGVRLFVRSKKGIALTLAGEDFLALAQPVNEALERIKNLKFMYPESPHDYITVANIYAFTFVDLFNDYFNRIAGENTHAFLREMPPDKIIDEVHYERATIGFTFYGVEYESEMMSLCAARGVTFHSLVREPFCVVLNREHPLFGRETISSDELKDYSFVVDRGKEGFYRRRFPAWFSGKRHAPMLFDNNRSALFYMAKSSDGFTMGQRSLNLTNPFVELGLLRYIPLSDAPFELVTGYVTKTGMSMSPTGEKFCEYVRRYFEKNFGCR